ncbi:MULTISPECIES: ABC transporter permease [unclassified Nocardioides]|uniref:ABC transporter permease n=1 Tax=unclassified Nocardioides TaxID=2615069 RepID=UPI00105583F9|nr:MULTISPECIES: ABC transporter permease [unclassified Nocardioides]
MLSTLSLRPAWRQLSIMAIALPVLVGLAVVAFAWPAARTEPRQLPVGIVGANGATEHAVSALEAEDPDGFDLKIYGDAGSATQAIKDRDIYGAVDVSEPQVTVYTASAASVTVASLLENLGERLQAEVGAGHTSISTGPHSSVSLNGTDLRSVDVVPADSNDPRGTVLTSVLLPLTICSIIIAAAIALALEFGPAWRLISALALVAALSGFAVYLVAQTWLGVLPHHGLETWMSLSLAILAISSTTAGLITLVGAPGLALGAALMVFVGNPFSASATAPQLLPGLADTVGQWLPPGAAANLIRSVTYFDGHDATAHVAILLAWTLFGCLAIVSGHHAFVGFAARRRAVERVAEHDEMSTPAPQHLAMPSADSPR